MPQKHIKKLRQKFEKMMSALYKESGSELRIEILQEPEMESFIQAHSQVLDSTFEQVEMSSTMREHLQQSDYLFSGFKTFHELNQAFPSLIDENGNKKPFNRFLNDVKTIDKTYNERYLRAEYNFASASAQMAAKWEQMAADGDEYYLQYRTAGDGAVRPEHAALHNVTLPASDSFWDTYYPPNGWNCRCTVVQVLKYMHEATPHDEAIERGAAALAKDKKGMFNFNPGKQQKTFPDYNPYTISKCRGCDIANDKTELVFIPENELCAVCRIIRQAQENRQSQRLTRDEFNQALQTATQWAAHNLDPVMINGRIAKRTIVRTDEGNIIGVGKNFFIETAHKNKRNPEVVHILKTATEFKNWLPKAERVRVESGRHHPFLFSVYTVEYQGRTIEFKCKMTDGELIYNMRFI